jgi:hypothetical protein
MHSPVRPAITTSAYALTYINPLHIAQTLSEVSSEYSINSSASGSSGSSAISSGASSSSSITLEPYQVEALQQLEV